MRKTAFICILAAILAASIIFSAFPGLKPDTVEAVTPSVESDSASTLDFSISLLRHQAEDGKNVLVSPLCASGALTAAALGSSGDTRTQLEAVLSPDGNLDALAQHLGSAISEYGAVSVWVNNDGRLQLSGDYADSVKNAMNAEVSFSDFVSVIDKMNNWVFNSTDGRIESIIDNVPPDAVMYILSALTFDGEWAVPFSSESVFTGDFTSSDGTVYSVDFMKSTENTYIETENAAGFVKPYTDGSCFVALLPDEGVSISDLLLSLDGDKFEQIMRSAQDKSVSICLPKFTAESDLSLSDSVISMGAADAFSKDDADFSLMGSDSLYISAFVQKTWLSVDENGTQGGAAAGIEVSLKSMPTVSVVLNRPFVYFIVKDGEMLFAGTLERF